MKEVEISDCSLVYINPCRVLDAKIDKIYAILYLYLVLYPISNFFYSLNQA